MHKQNDTLVGRFWKIIYFLIEPPSVITDIQKKRQARLLSTLLLIIILLGSVSGIIQLLIVPGFLGTFVAIAAAVIALLIAYAFTRTEYYLVAATIAAFTPSMASYAALLTNPKDQSAFVFLLISVLLSSILLDQWFTIGFAGLNLVGLLILPTLQPAWAFSVVAGKISFHIIIPALIVIAMRHRDLVEHDRQKELRESELKFRSIFDNSVDAIGVSQSGIHIMANPAYVRMFGCDNADQFVGKSILDLIAPSQRAQILDYVHRRPIEDNLPNNYETRGIRCDGTEFDMEVHVSTYELDGELYTVPILRDITQRKQAEEALRKSEVLYRQAIEIAGAVPYHQTYAENSTHVDYDFIGEGIYEITGYGPKEFNETIWDSLTQARFLLEDLAAYSFNDAIEHVRTGKYPIWKCEHRILDRDGKVHWVFEAAVELRDENGISHGSIGMFQDITERKQNQQEFEENRRRLAFLLDKSPAVIYSSRATGDFGATFVATNVASQLGYQPEDFTGNPNFWLEHIHSDDISRVLAELHKLYEQGIYVHEYRFKHKNGYYLWMRDEMTLIRSDSGEPLEIIGAWIDITERKQAEAEREKLIQELTDKNSELERFTYTVSHDLKSPLVTINGYLGYLEQDAAAGNHDRLKKDTQRIQEAVNKMYRLLNELLDLSRIGRVVNAPVRVQFHELVQEAMDVVRGQINASGVVIRVQPHLPVVYVDKPRIIEALQNLLDNAMKYMGNQPQPQIEIGQRCEQNGQPVLYIRDNGMGVAPEYYERIFGLFNKLDARSEGTGVGLALVKRIIEVHGGRIWIESELGQGSTFYITLPKAPTEI